MKIALVQIVPWERPRLVDVADFSVKIGDWVIINNEFGQDFGRIAGSGEKFSEVSEEKVGTIERLVTKEDRDFFESLNKNNQEAINYCYGVIKKYGLEMKIIGAHFSFDDKRIVFAFIADGRVDFRDIVKELTRHFQKNIRLFQLGVRDEAKLTGNIGCCGRELCCRSWLERLGNVTSELAEMQQVAHRGSERLSGICGRLKCCLVYEKDLYDELAKVLPAVGTRVRTQHGRGVVCGWHVLRQSVDVKIDPEKEGERPLIVEVPIKK